MDKLIDDMGATHRAKASKAQVAMEYFSNLFKFSNPTDIPDFFDGFQPRVISRMNEELTREVSKEEVKRAAFAIKATSAPRSQL